MRFLIVDDNEDNLRFLTLILRNQGHRVVSAHNGHEALEAARLLAPDRVVSDILMPGMDGYALCRAWMEDPALRPIPFIFYSATYTSAEDEAFALALGARAFIRKPQEPVAFLVAVEEAIERPARAASPPEGPLDDQAFLKLYNERLIRKLEQRAEKLKQSEERYRSLFEASRDAILIAEATTGLIVDANPAACALLGREREELVGRHQTALHPPEETEHYASLFRTSVEEGGGVHTADLRVVNSAGQPIPVEITASLFETESGPMLVGIFRDLREREMARRDLEEREERLRLATEVAGVAVWEYDFEAGRMSRSSNHDRLYGLERQETWTLDTFLNAVHPDDRQRCGATIEAAVSPGGDDHYAFDFRVLHPDGSTHWLNVIGQVAARDGTGRGRVVRGCLIDVSARRRAERDLLESEERFRGLFENAVLGLYRTTPDGEIVMANPALCRMLGFDSFDELRSRNLEERGFQPSYPRGEFKERVERSDVVLGLESAWTRKDGRPVHIRESARAVRDASGRTLWYDGTVEDITEKKEAEQALKGSEARYRALFERNVAGVYRSEVGTGLVECNEAFARMFGFDSPKQAMAHPLPDFYADSAELERFRAKLLASGSLMAEETHCRRKDGSDFWVLENAALVRDDPSGRSFVEGTCIDITDLKLAEKERLLLSTAIGQSHDSVVITDVKGAILYVNPAFERLTGFARVEALGRNPRILKSGVHDEAFYREMWTTILCGRVWSGRMVNRKKDGSHFLEFATISPVRDPSGAIAAFVAVKRDITHEEELERQLVDAKKLETVGMIASGVAHEVRNPLFAISTIVAALEKKLAGQAAYGEYVEHIKEQSVRLNTLMEDLLTLGRPIRTALFKSCLIREVLRGALDALEGLNPGTRHRVALDLPPETLPVAGIQDKLVQAVLNLLQNSLHFSPEEGAVAVAIRRDGAWVRLTVRDGGPGIAPDMLPRLFEPFQTGRKGGTGLGLAIVRQIVTAHGGTVEAANNDPPPGANFTVRLPIAAAEAPA